VARLLGAYTNEIDTRPGPLTDLLTAAVPNATPAGVGSATIIRSDRALADRALAAVTAEDDGTSWAAAGSPNLVPGSRRRRRVVVPGRWPSVRSARLVLGLGGVAAAVTGGGPSPRSGAQ